MPAQPALALLFALLGLAAGSVIIFAAPRLVSYRLPEPIPFPSPAVLLPLAGVAVTRWRPLRSITVELLTALTYALLALHYGASRKLLLGAIYAALLIAIAYIDVDHRLVLNRLSYPGLVVALAGSIFWPGIGLPRALLGALTGLAIFIALQIISRGALGTGDTKLATLIGAMRGLPAVLTALFYGIVLGGIAGVVLLLVMRRGRKEYFAYAPYLAAGAVVALLLTSP